jgi:hypothetical protein
MAHMAIRNRVPKTATALKLRSHSIDKLNHYDRRIGMGADAAEQMHSLAHRHRSSIPSPDS